MSGDARYHRLQQAEPDEVANEQDRYAKTGAACEDAVDRLRKISDGVAVDNNGYWMDPLRDQAQSIHDDLAKARVRYADAANYIHDYQPELDLAIKDAAAAVTAEDAGKDALTTANGLPDPQKGPDGTTSVEELQKGTDKQARIDAADNDVTAAKNKLLGVLDALDVAGKRLGDGVNCNNYDDGLSDSLRDKIIEVFKMISSIFGVIALIFTVLAFLIPGVALIAWAGLIAGAVLLISDSVLLGYGEAAWYDVLFDALGLGLAGAAVGFAKLANLLKGLPGAFRGWGATFGKGLPSSLEMFPGGVAPHVPKPSFFKGLGDFFKADWNTFKDGLKNYWFNLIKGGQGFKGNFKLFWDEYVEVLLDKETFKSITAILGGAGESLWTAWGTVNAAFGLILSTAYASYQVDKFRRGES